MSFAHKLKKELQEIAVTTLCFFAWFGVLVGLKRLYLAEYQIQFSGLSLAFVSALIVAKVVVVMEHVSLGQWVRTHPAIIDVLLRTLLYTIGVAVALVLEHGFEGRHEHGGFWASVVWVVQHREAHHVWADTIVVSWALLAFNAVSLVRRHLGEGRLYKIFLSPPPSPKKED